MLARVLSISVQDQYHGTVYEQQKCLHNSGLCEKQNHVIDYVLNDFCYFEIVAFCYNSESQHYNKIVISSLFMLLINFVPLNFSYRFYYICIVLF